MRIGISLFAWTSALVARHLEPLFALPDHGIDGFEVPMFAPEALPLTAIRRTSEQSGLGCTVCAILPQGINPISPDRQVRSRSLQHLKDCVAATAAMGSKLIAGPVYAPIAYLPEHRVSADEWQWATEIFQSLGDTLVEYDVTLALEPVNRSETFFLRTAKEAGKLVKAIGHLNIGLTIDTFHANIEEVNVAQAIVSLGPDFKHLHASENDRGLLGTGHIDFPAIVQALRQIDFNGYLMIEGFGYSKNEPNSPGYLWAAENVTPEDVAIKGAAYLRTMLDRY